MAFLKSFAHFLQFLGQRKKFWMIPLVFIFGMLALLLVSVEGTVFAPLIYTLF